MLRSIVVLILLSLSCAADADFNAAMSLYQKRDFGAALVEFKRLAAIGDHDAQFNIGVMYYRGESVDKDPIAGFAWISLAGDSAGKDAEPRKALANKIFENLDPAQKEAAERVRKDLLNTYGDAAISEKLAPVLASTNLGSRQRAIKIVTPVYPKSMLSAGNMGVVDLMYGIGKDGTVRDIGVLLASDKKFIDSAIDALKARQFEPASVDGKPVEVYGEVLRVNYVLDDVKFRERVILDDVAKLREKAENGSPSDQFQYAYLMQIIPSFTKLDIDTQDANLWYYNSAKSGNAKAQFFLGKNLLNGNACTVDSVKSLYWLESSANQGASDAQYLLAIEMLSGARLDRNKDAALRWLQKAAESNNANAQLRLAWILSTDTDNSVRNGVLAKSYVEKISAEVFDKRSFYETQAAVAAELGKFDEAINWQNKAMSELRHYELPLISASARLKAYQQNHAWTE